jgi:hypothetical protein
MYTNIRALLDRDAEPCFPSSEMSGSYYYKGQKPPSDHVPRSEGLKRSKDTPSSLFTSHIRLMGTISFLLLIIRYGTLGPVFLAPTYFLRGRSPKIVRVPIFEYGLIMFTQIPFKAVRPAPREDARGIDCVSMAVPRSALSE